MIKNILQPEKILNPLALILFFLIPGIGSHPYWEGSPIQMENLLFYERIIVDFYAGGERKEIAIRDLDTRCRFKDPQGGLSCANLAILLKNSGDLPRAYTASAIAYKKEPRNYYYRNLFQNLAMKSRNLKDMEKRMGRDGKISVRYTRAVQNCNQGFPGRAISDVEFLLEEGHLTKEQFQRGIFHECFKEDSELLSQLKSSARPNEVEYTSLLRSEEDRLNPYKDLWDLDYFRKEVKGKIDEKESKNFPEKNITKSWVQLKQNILEGNISQAKSEWVTVRRLLEEEKKKSKKNKTIIESLEMAMEITLTQDPLYKDKARSILTE